MLTKERLIEKINQLPPEFFQEVDDFIDFIQFKRSGLLLGGSLEDYQESFQEIRKHKEGKIKLSKAEDLLNES
jgi:hypothetical protein